MISKYLKVSLVLIFVICIYNFFAQDFINIAKRYKKEKIVDYEKISTFKVSFVSVNDNDLAYIPCLVNGVYNYFIFDTGCTAGLAINTSLFNNILASKKVSYQDYIGDAKMITANGDFSVVKIIILNEILLGSPSNSLRLNNVLTVVYDSEDGPLLIGQDILQRFSSISIENTNRIISLNK